MFGAYSNNPRDRQSQIRSTGIRGRSNIRRVFDNAQCAHVWAQQSQDNGRSNNGNLYFDGATIYSYRSGWPLGTFTQLPDGRRAIVLNVETYSNTTSGHLSDVRHAIRGLDGFEIIETNSLVAKYFSDAEYTPDSARYNPEYKTESRARAFAQLLDSDARRIREFAASLANPRKTIWGIDPTKWDNHGFDETAQGKLAARLMALNDQQNVIVQRAAMCGLDCPITVQEMETFHQAIRDAFAAFYDPAKIEKRSKAAKQRAARSALITARKWFNAIRKGEYIPYRHRGRFNEAFTTLIETRPESEWRDLWREYQVWRIACECNQVEATLNPLAADIRAARSWRKPSAITADEWLNGARGSFYQESPTLVRRAGDTLETSRGASCPFSHAVIAFRKAQDCRANGTTWQRNGQQIRVGHFNVDSIDAQGNMRAGCHTLTWEEMERLAVREIPNAVKPRFGLPALINS